MINYGLGKLLTNYFQWLINKILTQCGTIEHPLWEDSPLISPSRLRIIISRHCEGKFFSILFLQRYSEKYNLSNQ